ncbi:MAG: cysteine desulfurase [Patescibacteria group bacterium]|nr:cysteine desulfurase [Patescibacteria group bacterium]
MSIKIYLDYAATTPVDKKVMQAMLPYFSDRFGNASSLHSFGQEASQAVEKSRKQAADFFGCDSEEIIFTSGATESNNLAIKGVVKAYRSAQQTLGVSGRQVSQKPHIVTTSFEHHCVLDACKSLEKENLAEVTYINPKKDGVIKAADIKKAIKKNTILISVMCVNNEIGTVQPIKEIGKIVKEYNSQFKIQNSSPKADQPMAEKFKILLHTDATQAINYFDCNVDKLGVDLLSMSAHKIYGPKGVGALYVRKGTNIARVQDGGGQEFGKRAGTLNVPGIVGLGAAVAEIKNQKSKIKIVVSLRDYLIKKILKEIPDVKLNGSKVKRSPNNANFSFKNVEGESLLLMLDAEGIAASTGSACSSGSLRPSHVLLSLGMKPEKTHGSLRVTIGKYTTRKEIDISISKLKKIIKQLREISGNVLIDYYKKND